MGRKETEKRPILIAGIPGSGTSLVAGIFYHCGAWIDSCTFYNKFITSYFAKGMFHNWGLFCLMKMWLIKHGFDSKAQHHIPSTEFCKDWVRDNKDKWANNITSILINQDYNSNKKLVIRDDKVPLVWPLWNDAFPDANWVLVHRSDHDLIESFSKTAFMLGLKNNEQRQQYIGVYKERYEEMHRAKLSIQELHIDDILEGRYGVIQSIINDNDLIWDEDKINKFIEPKARRSKKRKERDIRNYH